MDDIAAKSQLKGDHLAYLREVFALIRSHQLKMNPAKSFIGVSAWKFLGFLNSEEICLNSEDAISEEPQGTHEVARPPGLHQKIHCQTLEKVPTLRQADEKGSLFRQE